jgi:hypothetical protein
MRKTFIQLSVLWIITNNVHLLKYFIIISKNYMEYFISRQLQTWRRSSDVLLENFKLVSIICSVNVHRNESLNYIITPHNKPKNVPSPLAKNREI